METNERIFKPGEKFTEHKTLHSGANLLAQSIAISVGDQAKSRAAHIGGGKFVGPLKIAYEERYLSFVNPDKAGKVTGIMVHQYLEDDKQRVEISFEPDCRVKHNLETAIHFMQDRGLKSYSAGGVPTDGFMKHFRPKEGMRARGGSFAQVYCSKAEDAPETLSGLIAFFRDSEDISSDPRIRQGMAEVLAALVEKNPDLAAIDSKLGRLAAIQRSSGVEATVG